MVKEVPEVACGAMQEAMPYEELNKLVNEDLLNQYIESRYSSRPCSLIPSVSGATLHLCPSHVCNLAVVTFLQHPGSSMCIVFCTCMFRGMRGEGVC